MRALAARQEGIALPLAAALLLVISLFVAAFWSTALRTSNSADRDRNAKRALAAAEAGLQVAVYRLNQVRNPAPPATSCLTTAAVPKDPVTGECPGHTEQLGNGASYTYWVTPVMGPTDQCTKLPGAVSTSNERCVTSMGTVNGVTRRVQVRVAVFQAPNVFAQAGLIGKSLVYAWNSVNMHSDVGSNQHVELVNSINVDADAQIGVAGRVMLLQGGTYNYQNSVTVDGGTVNVPTPFQFPPLDFEAAETVNDNASLPASVFEGGNPSARRFRLGNSVEFTMEPGTYHFCSVYLDNSVRWRFSHAGGQPTRIYVDSPSRPGSPCAAGDGTFGANNSAEINKEFGQREDLLDIFMHGTGQEQTRSPYSWCDLVFPVGPEECKSDFMLDNSVVLYGAVLAPDSTIQAHNSVQIFGGLAGDKLRLYNSVNFTLTGDLKNRPPPPPAAATREGWVECRSSEAVAGDHESGC